MIELKISLKSIDDIKIYLNEKDTLSAHLRPRGLYQPKSSMTLYKLRDIHLSPTKASALN